MAVLKLQSSLNVSANQAAASLSGDFRLQLDLLEPWLCRVAILPRAGLAVPNTWMISPEGEVPWEGRPRLSTDGFTCPRFLGPGILDTGFLGSGKGRTGVISVEGEFFKVSVSADPLAICIDHKTAGGRQPLLQDRPMAAYRYLPGRGQFHHAQLRSLEAQHLGLGDKPGGLDRTGKRFRCLQTDALGYNAETSDPLYKHVPWIITGNHVDGYCGLFYDTMSECVFDLGAEHSNYHAHYRTVEVFENALIYYVVLGPQLKEVVERFQWLVGMPHLQPRWASGFAHTSMHHADADNAQQVMTEFVDQCKTRNIPISALHSGSGYTTRDDGRRYVFTWNENKFPERNKFFDHLRKNELFSCANIKPVLLKEHPLFSEVESFGGFITDAEGQPAIEMFWGGPGASLDFTNPKTIKWWQDGVKEQVLGAGFTSTWNDNNECEIWDEEARLNGFGDGLRAMDVRPIQAILMLRASFEAAKEFDASNRPYIISRAGPVGISRYAQTWSGDNYTSWHTLKWNLANGLSMSLSGFPLVGHDIGGFVGPKPDSELLCRWFEMMALHPRAVMNSWKPQEEDPASLPWMHASVEDEVRSVLELRYHLLPWLYHLGWKAHVEGVPVITPMLYYFDDAACQSDVSQFMLGESVLVAPVVEQGMTCREVYLPVTEGGWYRWSPDAGNDCELLKGGRVISVDAPLGQLPVFVRAGSVLPVAKKWLQCKPHDATEIALTCFALPASGDFTQPVFYDDGLSWNYLKQQVANLSATVHCDANQVQLRVERQWSADASLQWVHDFVGLNGREFSIV